MEPITSRLPRVPTTDAKLITLIYGKVSVGALYSSDVLLPFSEDANSIACVIGRKPQLYRKQNFIFVVKLCHILCYLDCQR